MEHLTSQKTLPIDLSSMGLVPHLGPLEPHVKPYRRNYAYTTIQLHRVNQSVWWSGAQLVGETCRAMQESLISMSFHIAWRGCRVSFRIAHSSSHV